MNLRIAFIAGISALAFVVAVDEPAVGFEAAQANFITRQGDKLFDGDREYRFISFNIPNLIVIEDAYEFTKPNPWRWPDKFEIEDSLESVRQIGGQVVRTYVLSVHRDGSDMGEFVHVRQPGEFNEEGFKALDKVIEIAGRKGIRVIIPFVDQAKWWGGIGEYAAFRGKPADAFWTDPQIIDDFKKTVHYLLTRKNTYTGVAYKDDPTILGWETGNEIDATPEWTRQISAYLKELDPKHLVIDGNSLKGVPAKSLEDPNVDVITTHHYPFGVDHDFVKPIRAAHALTKGKKAYFVGEFGFVEMPHIASAINAVVNDGISGALLWSLRMHRREGGFYWHMEVGTGKNIYKAFHWPGFTSGDRYDERQVLKIVRDKAFAIRGMSPPPIERPASPKLLPIEKVSAISWQGSAGAESYDVYRASAADGTWTKVADKVSDAEVQYRPLFHDDSAVPGQSYWYRVVARNMAGDSEPSNSVGPVTPDCRTLVDECRDLSLTASTAGKVTPASENARTVQEDCHRLVLNPGAAIVYRVDGPISRFKVYAFAPTQADLTVDVSSDGKKFTPIKSQRKIFASGQTVYGYLTPILFSGSIVDGRPTYLRIALDDSKTNEKTSRNADSAKPSAAVELSAVEIQYDRNEQAAELPSDKEAAQLNSSIFVYSARPIYDSLRSIDEAAARGERRLNVVVTILVDLTDDLHIKTFGDFPAYGSDYKPCDDAMRGELKEKLRRIFAQMVEHNMDIAILPHIDAGGKVQQWRNWVVFDPTETYSGYSYDGLMLGTIVDALAETVTPETRVELALSGEMGTSLFTYPESYRNVIRKLRNRSDLKQLLVGISLNHGGIAGHNSPTGANDIELSDDERQQMQSLIDECDFIGMSFYAPVSVSPTPDDFVRGIERFMNEFKQHGLTIPTTKPMQFSEVGIGGRRMRNGKTDPGKAVETPWEGTADPSENPWANSTMRQLRRDYHTALIQFLVDQPAPWRVSSAFFWSMGSWDPLGHGQSEFSDSDIMSAVERLNRIATP